MPHALDAIDAVDADFYADRKAKCRGTVTIDQEEHDCLMAITAAVYGVMVEDATLEELEKAWNRYDALSDGESMRAYKSLIRQENLKKETLKRAYELAKMTQKTAYTRVAKLKCEQVVKGYEKIMRERASLQ